MESLRFVRPGNLHGVGFLILFGGVPQFSIAWNATREPERITLENASGEGLTINDKPANCYRVVLAETPQGLCISLEENPEPQEAEATSDGNGEPQAELPASESTAKKTKAKS